MEIEIVVAVAVVVQKYVQYFFLNSQQKDTTSVFNVIN